MASSATAILGRSLWQQASQSGLWKHSLDKSVSTEVEPKGRILPCNQLHAHLLELPHRESHVCPWYGVQQKVDFSPSHFFSGESAFTTIAPCVLGDLFTDETRSLVYGLFYMGEWMKNFVLASSTPSHSVWQRSWFCSWWGSIRVEVVPNFLSLF